MKDELLRFDVESETSVRVFASQEELCVLYTVSNEIIAKIKRTQGMSFAKLEEFYALEPTEWGTVFNTMIEAIWARYAMTINHMAELNLVTAYAMYHELKSVKEAFRNYCADCAGQEAIV